MNKVEYSHVNIFYKEKLFFANLHGNIRLQVFQKLKLYAESPKVIVKKCVVTGCTTGYKTGHKKALFIFEED